MIMDHIPTKPKMRWCQYRLKTLLLLPVVVGIGSYCYAWRQHRPPIQEYDSEPYRMAFERFAEDLKSRNLNHAYASTSARFKHRMSPSQFEVLMRSYPTVSEIEVFEERWADDDAIRWADDDAIGLRNWMTVIQRIRGRDGKWIELWVWVVMNDSFFYRRPPVPQVEEVQIRTIDGMYLLDLFVPFEPPPDLKPSWEQE